MVANLDYEVLDPSMQTGQKIRQSLRFLGSAGERRTGWLLLAFYFLCKCILPYMHTVCLMFVIC